MNEDGKKTEVLIEKNIYADPRTGVETKPTSMTVWADENMKEVISSVSGVTHVFNNTTKTRFDVYTDPRYDIDFIIKEIELRILEAGKL